MKRNTFLTVFLLTLAQGISWAQVFYFEPGFDLGHHTPFSTKHAYIIDYPHYGFDLRIGKGHQGFLIGYTHHTLDSVIYYTHEGNQYGSIGDCFSLTYFVDGHAYKGKRWSFDYDIIYGADLWTRHGNEMLGSALNFHVSLDLGPTIRLNERLDAAFRYGYYHSSNGATFLPNNGINTHFLRMALRYYPDGKTEPIQSESKSFEKKNNLMISEGMGWLQTYTRLDGQLPNETPFFFGNTFRIGFSRQFHPRFRWDVAVDFLWTGETRYRYELLGENYHPWNAVHFATSADFEAQFGRIAFCAGTAYYLYHGIYANTTEHKSWGKLTEFEKNHLPEFYTPYYERIGCKLYFDKNRNYFFGTFLKIHFNSIDHIEWTFGCNL
ncbi:MAG: acyloxyacyl hydrolase [Bacteroidales bacterium]|nr:acyloxyacyl hydrolase [Bacteroidales bacterium]